MRINGVAVAPCTGQCRDCHGYRVSDVCGCANLPQSFSKNPSTKSSVEWSASAMARKIRRDTAFLQKGLR